MRELTVETSCEAIVCETWTIEVSDDFDEGDHQAVLEAVGERGVLLFEDIGNEHDRQVNHVASYAIEDAS